MFGAAGASCSFASQRPGKAGETATFPVSSFDRRGHCGALGRAGEIGARNGRDRRNIGLVARSSGGAGRPRPRGGARSPFLADVDLRLAGLMGHDEAHFRADDLVEASDGVSSPV